MEKSINGNMQMPSFAAIIAGVGISAGICAVLLMLFAAVLTKTNSGDTAVLIMALLSQSSGCFFGGFISAKINKKSGMAVGAINGAVVFILLTLLGLIFGGSLGLLTAVKLVLCILCSALGGILGVNSHKKPNII